VVQIGWDALLLLTNPGQWQALSDKPALIPNAVEELLRASPRGGAGIAGIPRYARTDFEIDDVAIGTGDLVVLDIGSANHDPAVFIDPDSVDVARKQPAHLTFGYGAHYCIGAPLARIELKTVFAQLIPRFPSMQLTVDPATLWVRRDVLAGGLGELPVSW
jgi:cytochrome P450